MESWQTEYQKSISNPVDFWERASELVHWFQKADKILDDGKQPLYQWFSGSKSNICYNCLDVNLQEGRGDKPALIWESPVSASSQTYTFGEVFHEVGLIANGLRNLGVEKGDRVVIYMPNIPQAVFSMLACARIGAIHSVVFGGFAPPELAKRIDDADPKAILYASHAFEKGQVINYQSLVDEALDLVEKPLKVAVRFNRMEGAQESRHRPICWNDLKLHGNDVATCEHLDPSDPLYILYTSGTTGNPKGVIHDHTGYMLALKWSMQHVYQINEGDVFWAASDIGWAVGHSYIVYGPMLAGACALLYEGKPVGTPDETIYWQLCQKHHVKTLFTAPTALRSIKAKDPEGKKMGAFKLPNLKAVFLAGERSDTDTLSWLEKNLKVPAIDHWWQTETGWPMTATCLGYDGQSMKQGSCGRPVPGYQIEVVDDSGKPLPTNQAGNIVVRLPLPPGTLPSLWNNDKGFVDTYLSNFPGYFETYDAGYFDEDHNLWIISRTDDVINCAGHRLSTAQIEEVLSCHEDVAECAVVGVKDALKSQVPVGFVVLNQGSEPMDNKQLTSQLIDKVKHDLGAVWAFKTLFVVPALPKTRSGKVLRNVLRNLLDGEPAKVPPTIEDLGVLEQVRQAISLRMP